MQKLGSQVCLKILLPSFVNLPIGNVIKTEKMVLTHSQFVRNTSFFTKLTHQQLWKGVTSVSNAGRKKGRGKRKELINMINLYEGQKLGYGKAKIAWPGLNTPLFKGDELSEVEKLAKVEKPEVPTRKVVLKKKRKQMHPLERGWSGRKAKGKKIGPPDALNNVSFEGFESIILEQKARSMLTSVLGRKRKIFTIVATGNGNGLIGLGVSVKADSISGMNLAKKKASKRLIAIDLIESHTVNHDFFTEYGRTKIFVYKKSKGHGLICHRVIKALCQLIGIENLSASIEGPCNVIHIIRAFITGLRRQKTYQEIADDVKLHLVEFREESFNFPRVLASPEKCLTLKDTMGKPILFEEYIMGSLVYKPDRKIPFYEKLPSWQTHLKRTLYCRNHDKVKIQLMAKYDSCKSHLSEIYPECTEVTLYKKRDAT